MEGGSTGAFSLWRLAPYYTEDGWTPASVLFLQLSIFFLTLVYMFETYLDVRQYQKHKETAFPEPLADAIQALDPAAQKPKKSSSAKDSEDNTSDDEEAEEEAGVEKPASVVVSLLDTTLAKFDKSRVYAPIGYLPFLWDVSGHALIALGLNANSEIYRSVMLFTLNFLLIDQFVKLPIELYTNFVVEERHGFNRQNLGFFVKDKAKEILLLIGIGCPITATLVYLVRWGGDRFYIYVWVFQGAGVAAFVTAMPIWLLPLMYKFTSLEDGELRTRVEALALSLKFPLGYISVMDGSSSSGHVGAFIAGFVSNLRIVLFDTLLEQSTDDEVVGALAHELGHWKLAHGFKGFLIEQVQNFARAYVFGMCMNNRELFASFGFACGSGMPLMIDYMLFSKTVWAPVHHVMEFLWRLHTCHTELQADAFAVDLGHGDALKSALTKVGIGNLANLNPDPLYSKYHYDHPPLVERLAAITARMKKSM